jgi:hypothetical protein
MISKYGTNRENHPSFDGAAWCVVSGRVTKDRVYGAPRMPKSIVSTSSSSHSYSVESLYPNSSLRALQKEIKNKEEEIKKKDDFILEMTPMGPTSQLIYRPTPRLLYPDPSCVDQQYHGSSSQPAP